jgi:2-dehydropantoate 2-reductase
MKIAVMGSVGVGGYFGGRLAAAGCDVRFVARGAHLEAMRTRGLRIHSPEGDFHLAETKATDDPGSIGPVDIVLFTVKLYDMEEAARAIRPLLGADTAVIPFLNGVEAVAALGQAVGPGHVMGGVAYIFSVIEEPGVIRRIGTMARLLFGELDGTASRRAAAFKEACDGAGIAAVLSENVELDIWKKLVVCRRSPG